MNEAHHPAPDLPAPVKMTNPKIIGDFVIENEIGKGSFATVYKGFRLSNGQSVAVKVISKEKLNKRLLQNLEAEISIMRSCSHDNIVELIETRKTENHYYLVMEYCAGGDFSKWLRKRKVICENDARYFLKQLANGLALMREKNLIHRDLKPQNLLLTERNKEHCCLKIADFGFAKHLNGAADLAATVCGSPLYMAPEILFYQKYDSKADLWSAGIILYEMLWGKPPFRADNHIELTRKLSQKPQLKFPNYIQIIERIKNDPNGVPQCTVIPISVSEECKDMLSRLLALDSRERISFEDFFHHPFFKGPLNAPLPPTKCLFSQAKEEFPQEEEPSPSAEDFEEAEEENLPAKIENLLSTCSENELQVYKKLCKEVKYASFLVQLFEETGNKTILVEIVQFLVASVEYAKKRLVNVRRTAPKIQKIAKWINETVEKCLETLDSTNTSQAPDTEKVNTKNLMLLKAIETGKNAAVEEALGYLESALHLYEIAHFLFCFIVGDHQNSCNIKEGEIFELSNDSESSLCSQNPVKEEEALQKFHELLNLRIIHLRSICKVC